LKRREYARPRIFCIFCVRDPPTGSGPYGKAVRCRLSHETPLGVRKYYPRCLKPWWTPYGFGLIWWPWSVIVWRVWIG
jgi:hypothetical protein